MFDKDKVCMSKPRNKSVPFLSMYAVRIRDTNCDVWYCAFYKLVELFGQTRRRRDPLTWRYSSEAVEGAYFSLGSGSRVLAGEQKRFYLAPLTAVQEGLEGRRELVVNQCVELVLLQRNVELRECGQSKYLEKRNRQPLLTTVKEYNYETSIFSLLYVRQRCLRLQNMGPLVDNAY